MQAVTIDGVTINHESRLFTIKCGEGFSCLGFDVVYKRLKQLVDYLGLSLPVKDDEKGTMAQYAHYQQAVQAASQAKIKATWFDPDTPVAVKRVLERARNDETKVRIFLGDPDTGRSWLEENDTIGRIGRSTGIFKVPLLIEEGECGGDAILTANVIRIMDVDTGKDLYRHKKWHTPEMQIRSVSDLVDQPGTTKLGRQLQQHKLTHSVWIKEKDEAWSNQANFRSYGAACAYVAFMTGDSMCQPS